jgi:hypothetical protein
MTSRQVDLNIPDLTDDAEGSTGFPTLVAALLLLGLAVVVWPPILEKFVSLDWRIGNMQLPAYGISIILGVSSVVPVFVRRSVNRSLRRIVPSGRQFALATITILLSLVCGLLAIEGLLRALHLPFPAEAPPITGVRFDMELGGVALAGFDPELGWAYFPNRTVVQEFGDDHRKIPMYFDDLGMRVGKPGAKADRSAPSVLIVDASYGFGHGLPYEESFAGQLAARPDFPWQVVDLSVEGYGPDQSFLLLKRYFKTFNTKVVVFNWTESQWLIDSDGLYDLRIRHPRSRFLGTKPLFALKPDGTLYLAKKPVEYSHYGFSRVWACLEILYQHWGPKPSVRLTRALIAAMRDYAESNGAKFVVIDWDQRAPGTPKLAWPEGKFPWGLDVDVIRTGAHPPAGWLTWFIPGDGHPDARAHHYVAELVATELNRLMYPGALASGGR